MPTFRAKYKCRLCGSRYHNSINTGNYRLAWQCCFEVCRTFKPNKGEPLSPTLLEIHHCNNGSIGIADFEGWECVNNDN